MVHPRELQDHPAGAVGKTALGVAEVSSTVAGSPLLGMPTFQTGVWLWRPEGPNEEVIQTTDLTEPHQTRVSDAIRLDLQSSG
jgi:hypothetical protein